LLTVQACWDVWLCWH